MVNAVYCEFLKVKKTLLYIMLGLIVFQLSFLIKNIGAVDPINWHSHLIHVELVNFFSTYIVMFVMIAAYIFSREFKDNTATILYSYPLSVIKIFISKLIFITFIIISVYVIEFTLTLLGGLMIPHEELTGEIILIHSKIHVYSIFFQIALSPLTIFISLLSRNIIIPSIYGISLMFMNVLAMNIKKCYFQCVPSLLPALPVLMHFRTLESLSADMINIPQRSILAGIVTFLVGITACVLYYKKADIC